MSKFALVTPVYDDQESFTELCRRLAEVAGEACVEFYVIAVDDGSLAAPPATEDIAKAGLPGEVLRLGRNVGHQTAIAVGLARAAELAEEGGDIEGCVIMDCDGEDRPEAIPELLAAIGRTRRIDVAVAERARRHESFVFQFSYAIHRVVFAVLTGKRLRFGNFMALNPAALERLSGMYETATHVAAATVKAKLRRADLPIDRGVRFAGKSKMNFASLVLHAMRALMVFSEMVLTRLALALGALASLVVIALVGAGAAKLTGNASDGWLTIVTGFGVSVFLQAGLFVMITLIVSSLGRVDTPPRVRARALEFVARIEKANKDALVAAQ